MTGCGVVDKLIRHRAGRHFGFIHPDDGPNQRDGLHFLVSAVQGGPVTIGARVEFEEVDSEHGPRAVHVRVVRDETADA